LDKHFIVVISIGYNHLLIVTHICTLWGGGIWGDTPPQNWAKVGVPARG
jgi:hypothetical protein